MEASNNTAVFTLSKRVYDRVDRKSHADSICIPIVIVLGLFHILIDIGFCFNFMKPWHVSVITLLTIFFEITAAGNVCAAGDLGGEVRILIPALVVFVGAQCVRTTWVLFWIVFWADPFVSFKSTCLVAVPELSGAVPALSGAVIAWLIVKWMLTD